MTCLKRKFEHWESVTPINKAINSKSLTHTIHLQGYSYLSQHVRHLQDNEFKLQVAVWQHCESVGENIWT
jgi:hypothetical protein